VPPSDPDLLDLARRAAVGDRRAAHTLLLEVGPTMLRAVRWVLARATPDIEDVVQESMHAFVAALPTFRAESTVVCFARRVAVLTALANRRRLDLRSQWVVDMTGASAEEAIAPGPSPADAVLLRGRREALGRLLDDLPASQAEALVLHVAFGFTVEEVAAAVGRSPETVRSRLRLAKQGVRERIEASPGLDDILRVKL
jgi:RNA polymerase sigma-70 factor (ECF subfamily)